MLLIRNKIEPLAQLVLVIYLMVIQEIQPEVIKLLLIDMMLIKVFPETPELFSLYLIIRVSMISQVMFMNT